MQILNELAVNAIIIFFIVMFFATCPRADRAIKEDEAENSKV